MFQKSLRREGQRMGGEGQCVWATGSGPTEKTWVKILLKGLSPGLRPLNKLMFKRSLVIQVISTVSKTLWLSLPELSRSASFYKSTEFLVWPSFKEKRKGPPLINPERGVDDLTALKKGK